MSDELKVMSKEERVALRCDVFSLITFNSSLITHHLE
jgi:hypothetical protein